MSDLYLVLRSRLDAVAEWVTIGDELALAQKALGLSDERVAREVSVSTRTWIRWRQRGQVPIYMVEKVATVLHLEIERAAPRSILLEENEVVTVLNAVGERADEILAALERLDRRLDTEITARLDRIEEELRVVARHQTAPTT